MRALTAAGASEATEALARLLEVGVSLDSLRPFEVERDQLPLALFGLGDWPAAILTELSGAVRGQTGVALSRSVVERVIEQFLVDYEKDVSSERARAALAEVGNIVISAAAGGLATLSGGTVLPSVPHLVFRPDDVAPLVRAWADLDPDPAPAYLCDAGFTDRGMLLQVRFAWIPGAG
jgi:chemotaxis protein CheY-P-specific phosphatase CheC